LSRRKSKKFSSKDNSFQDALELGGKTELFRLKKIIEEKSKDHFPFEVLQITLDYIESRIRSA
jgi:hypothetical protein